RLRGASAVPSSAVTNRRGIATFRVPAGSTAGTYRVSVVLANGSAIGPGGQIDLVTTPAQVAGAEADPAEVTHGAVTISVIDRYGNRVPGVPLELRPVTAELAGAYQGTTDQAGQVAFTLPLGSVRRAGEVAILSRGTRIGAFSVRPAPQVPSDRGTQFTRG